MCDPVSLLVGAVGGVALSRRGGGSSAPAPAATAAPSTAAEDQAAAERAATQAANAKIVERQRRRRSQGGLTATLGAGADPLGAKPQPTGNPNAYQAVMNQVAPMGLVTAGRAGSGNVMGGGGAGGGYGGYKPAKV